MSEHDWQSLAGVLPDRNLPIETADWELRPVSEWRDRDRRLG